MRDIYSRYLMFKKNKRKDVIKGGVLLSAIVLLIGTLFIMGTQAHQGSLADQYVSCHEGANGAISCKFD